MKPIIIINVCLDGDKKHREYYFKISIFDVFYGVMRPLFNIKSDTPEYIRFCEKMDAIRLRKFVYLNGDYKGVIY